MSTTTQTKSTVDQERDLLVRCVEDAYESIRLLPGLDANGPAIVWFAEHMWEAYHRERGD
ncbi:hypothetical protein ACVGVM_08960 [Pseudonocardia bannensis]|uniref:Uncharacterized protein n=1 Tax=Pseudonocardia bannensis TaxID=630973 RepID=A0A848DCA6_9PSEU|nr:hypothetical protein [Pseudonocardia bannensis]NMH90266.1 hypothetical protein [Pseudonocardia bannensis]